MFFKITNAAPFQNQAEDQLRENALRATARLVESRDGPVFAKLLMESHPGLAKTMAESRRIRDDASKRWMYSFVSDPFKRFFFSI